MNLSNYLNQNKNFHQNNLCEKYKNDHCIQLRSKQFDR